MTNIPPFLRGFFTEGLREQDHETVSIDNFKVNDSDLKK